MTLNSEQIVRKAYQIAEDMDLTGWVAAFTEDGTFTDQSIGVTYRGPDELPVQVENYKRAFPDIHRELYQMYVSGNIVVVQLALQGTHLGPLHLPVGTLRPTGKQMDAPCCDVFELSDGKIKRFDCYPEGSVILTQLGVIGNLSAALEQWPETKQISRWTSPGSTNVGRIIGVQAAQHLKPAVLELGGKNPLLILEEWPGPEAFTVEMPGDLPLEDHRANGELFARRWQPVALAW